jgi:hypothetical protein
MNPDEVPAQNRSPDRQDAKRELDSLVINIELTLTSIIQGVALYFLTDNAREPLSNGQYEYWLYVANGLSVIFLFWSRSVAHTLTVIHWPIEFSHNFLYITCSLFEAVAFTKVKDPLQWYAFNAVFAGAVWILFVFDREMILLHQRGARSAAEQKLYSMIGADQDRNIRFLVPMFIAFFLLTALAVLKWPEPFLTHHIHVVAGGAQFVGLILYLIYVIRFFGQLSPLILASKAGPV